MLRGFTGRTPLIGRESELAEIASRLGASGAETGQVIVVSGEAGVGKTRLVSEAASRAEADGWLVLAGQASGAQGEPPYSLFTEAINDYVASLDPEELASIADQMPELHGLLPASGLPHGEPAPVVTPMSERFRFFEAVSDLLAGIAARQSRGMLLCLDDVHLADEASLYLVEHLARRLRGERVAVLAAYQGDATDGSEPLRRTLESLIRKRRALHIELKSLNLEETRQLLAELASSKPPAAVATAFYRESEGNPFYIEELFATLYADGRLFDVEGRWRTQLTFGEAEVPRELRLLVTRRLDGVSAGCREALTVAAILGRRFDYDLLREVSGIQGEVLLGALDEATRHGLIRDDADGMAFSHELVRQTLLNAISLPRRQQLHLRAAEALERLPDPGASRHSGGSGKRPYRQRGDRLQMLAGHYHLAGPLASAQIVMENCAKAGVQAAAGFAFEEALRLYDIALDSAARMDSTPEIERAIRGLHKHRADALFSLGRWREASSDLEATLDNSTPQERAHVLVHLALASSWTPDMPAAKRYTASAAELVEKLGFHDLDATLAALRAHCDVDDGDLDRAISNFELSVSLPGTGGSGAYRRLLWLFPATLYQVARYRDAISIAEAAVAIARQAGDVAELANLLPSLGLALGAAGRYREADRALAEGRRVANDFQAPGLVAISKSAGFHIETFDLAGARAFAEEAHDPATSVEHWPFPTVSSGLDLVIIAARGGEAGEAGDRLKRVVRQVEGAMGRHGWLWRMRLAQAQAEVAMAKADWQQAVEAAGEALQQSAAISRPKYQALALETRGKALIELGRKRDGMSDLRRAIEVARPVGDPAMFLRAAAELLAFDGDDSLVAEAYEAVERIVADLPDAMVAGFLEAEPVRLVSGLRQSPVRRPRLPAGLSPRELEVLRLIANGRSNQQIAAELVLSVRTVERHINHIFAKANVSSRTQAVAFAMREGVAEHSG